jgi:hypothetical protein
LNSLDTEFHRRLKKKLAEEATQQSVNIDSGAMDFPEYKRQCGRLQALREVGEWCKEIESNMSQGK